MSILRWPQSERPRERLLKQGGQSLSNAELLAIFFRTGRKGKTAIDLGRELLERSGSLRALAKISFKEFCEISGLGLAKYVQLLAALEFFERCLSETLKFKTLKTSDQMYRYLKFKLRDRGKEIFVCLFLNHKNKVTAYEEMFQGTLNCSVVYPREIVKQALKYHAAGVILGHNHPSGDPKPSLADKRLTKAIQCALSSLDILVLDHVIVGEEALFSFAEHGLLKPMN